MDAITGNELLPTVYVSQTGSIAKDGTLHNTLMAGISRQPQHPLAIVSVDASQYTSVVYHKEVIKMYGSTSVLVYVAMCAVVDPILGSIKTKWSCGIHKGFRVIPHEPNSCTARCTRAGP